MRRIFGNGVAIGRDARPKREARFATPTSRALLLLPRLECVADKILAAMLPSMDEPPDDVTLLLVQIPEPPRSSANASLPAEPASAAAARRFVSKTLAEWGHPEHLDTVCLLVSEIVTNAVRHARAPLELRLHLTSREIITEITDDSTHLPQRHLAGPDDEGGRGLMLVDMLATRWGTRPADTGKTVWFTMALVPPDV